MSSFENLALVNFYLGRVDKSDYYIDRMLRGKTEANFSMMRKKAL